MPVERIRGRKLQAIRNRVLRANPLCEACGKRAAIEVDHIAPLYKGGDDSPYSDANRQALCEGCHAEKTRRDMNQRQQIGLDGYPIPNA
jgi:5-methylcytosine-specific restriction endonuclease McrA